MQEDSKISIKELQLENEKLKQIIHEQKERLDDIVSSVNEVIWTRRFDDFSLIYINNACLNVFGYTPDELLNDGGIKFNHVHPEDKAKLDAQIKKGIEKGYGSLEYRIIHKDGSVKHIFSQSVVKKDSNGKPIQFNGTSIDVTNLREKENDLRKKVEEIENIFESITDSFISIDKNWNISYVNKQFESLLNRKREELIGKNLWASFPAITTSPFANNYYRAMNDREVVHSEGVSPSTGRILSVNFYPTDTGIAVYFKDITEERELQDKILNNEQSLRAIINNTKDIIWSMDTGMTVISANEAYYDRVALITQNKNYEELTNDDFSKERLEKWTAYFSRAFSGEAFNVVEEDIVVDKTVFEEISFNPIHDKDNHIVGVSCFSRDITEQKRLQDKIINNEQNLRALINNTSDFIWSVDMDLNIISINDSYKDFIYGLTRKIVKPGNNIISDSLKEDYKEKWKNHYEKALAGKRVIFVEEDIVNNEKQYWEIRLHPIIGKNEIITGVSCFARDITAETKLHAEIHKNEQNLEATINNTKDSIWSVDRDLNIILINDASKNFIYKMTGIVAQPGSHALWKGMPVEFLELRKNHYERALAGEAFKVINDLDWNESKPCYETSFNPIRDSKGNVLGVSCVARDISEHKKHLKKIQEQNDKLTEIAWIQSHKVRGPVANILGLAQLFNTKDHLDPGNKEIIEGIRAATQSLDSIIHEVVGITSVLSGN